MPGVRLKGFKRLVRADEALDLLLERVKVALGVEEVSLEAAQNRVLASDITAIRDIPAWPKAAMDGYAVRAEDTYGASQSSPRVLRLKGRIPIGVEPQVKVGLGECAFIPTGGLLPAGADAVVMIEFTKEVGGEVEVYQPVVPRQNVIPVGEDVRQGSRLLAKGTRLGPYDISLLAAQGIGRVKVWAKPRVALLSTGEELVELGKPLAPGQIYDSNRWMLKALVCEAGGEPVDLGLVGDDRAAIREKLLEGLQHADMVVTSAGTSVGERDLVPEVVEELGDLLVHGVALRPGYPTGIGLIDGKPVFLLSGFPVACAVGFLTFVEPLIHHLQGAKPEPHPYVTARLTRRVVNPGGLRVHVRVRLRREGDGWTAEPIRASGSSVLSSLATATGLLIIPEDREGFEEGEMVQVRVLKPLEV